MKDFQVLPTNPDFMALTEQQIEYIAYSMEKDREEFVQSQRNMKQDADYTDYDDSWWTADHDSFTALRDDHDEEDIARQVNAMTSEKDKQTLRSRLDASYEADGIIDAGGTTVEQDSIQAIMARNLEKVLQEANELAKTGTNKWGEKTEIELNEEEQARRLALKPITQQSIDEAIAIFEDNGETGVDPVMYIPSQDDDFYI